MLSVRAGVGDPSVGSTTRGPSEVGTSAGGGLDHNGGASAGGRGAAAQAGAATPDAEVRIWWIPGLGSCPGGVDVGLIDPRTGRTSQVRALSVDDARRWAAQRAAAAGDAAIIEDLERLLSINGIGGRRL